MRKLGAALVQRLAREPLRHRSFRRLWLGLALSRAGDQLTIVSLLWFLIEAGASGSALGGALLCFSLPGIISGPLIGRWLDRVAPQPLIRADNLLRALVIAAIPLLHWAGLLAPWMIYALAAIAGALTPATEVGLRVLLPAIVDDAELERANALLASCEQLAYLIGPLLAGLLIERLGAPPVLLLDSVSFVLMALLIGGASGSALAPPARRLPTVSALAQLRQLGRRLGGLRSVLTLLALSFCFNFAYGPLEPALPLYSTALGAGAGGYGLLWSVFGAGALLGLLLTSRLARLGRPGLVCAVIAILWGLCLLPLSRANSLAPALLCYALAGLVWAPYIPLEISALQRLAPIGLRGQVFGAHSAMLTAAVPLGVLTGALLLELLPVTTVIALSALACLCAGIVGLFVPALRRLKTIDAAP